MDMGLVTRHGFPVRHKRLPDQVADPIVTNGDFSDGLSGWGTVNGELVSVSGGECIIANTGSKGRITQTVYTDAASVTLSIDLTSVAGGKLRVSVYSEDGGTTINIKGIQTTTPGTHDYTFAPIGGGVHFKILNINTSSTIAFDDVTITEN